MNSGAMEGQQVTIQRDTRQPEKRPLPYFQCFASDWMACEEYVFMSAAERGLLFSMLNAAWVNGSVPADSANLARIVQLEEPSVSSGLTKRVLKWFTGQAGDPARLICTELERQRAESIAHRQKLADGGRRGGNATQAKYRGQAANSSEASSLASSLAKAPEMRCDEMKRDEVKRNASLERAELTQEHKAWVEDYDKASPH